MNMKKAKKIAEDAVKEWYAENGGKNAIRDRVFQMLDETRDEIIVKLMGFDNKWFGRWELDHCNGRSGNSAAGDFLREVAGDATKEWLANNGADLTNIPIPKNAINELKREYKRAIIAGIERTLETEARDRVANIAASIVDSISEDEIVKE